MNPRPAPKPFGSMAPDERAFILRLLRVLIAESVSYRRLLASMGFIGQEVMEEQSIELYNRGMLKLAAAPSKEAPRELAMAAMIFNPVAGRYQRIVFEE